MLYPACSNDGCVQSDRSDTRHVCQQFETVAVIKAMPSDCCAGGIMLAVCVLELWPEAKKCRRDVWAYQGTALGCIVMGLTLAADV